MTEIVEENLAPIIRPKKMSSEEFAKELQAFIDLHPKSIISWTIYAVERWLNFVSFLPDHPTVFRLWRKLVSQYQVLRKAAHDTRLAATAMFYQCDDIITFNAADFHRYSSIKTLTSEQVLQATP